MSIPSASPGLTKLLIPQIIFTICFLVFSLPANSQSNTPEFFQQSLSYTNSGLYILGSWALLNIGTGAAGWYHYQGEKQYFHQMNLFWNTINLAIAAGGIFSNNNIDLSLLNDQQMMAKHLQTENIFLINAGLDLLYMAAGYGMIHQASKYPKQYERLRGYGKSVILQGAFLMVFDAAAFAWQRNFRLNYSEEISLQLQPGLNQLGLILTF
jgi:hypothetical protein